MKTIRLYTYLLLCMQLLLVGCSDSDSESSTPLPTPNIELSVAELTFEADGGSKDLIVTANGKWTATVDQPAWCSVVTSGSKATVDVKKNDSNDERNTKVEFACGEKKAILTVTQKGQKALLVSSSKVPVTAKAQSVDIVVKSNVTYTAQIDEAAAEWISAGQSRSLTEKTHTFQIAENKTNQKREGKIVFSGEGLTETVNIYQEAGEAPQLVLTQNEYVLTDEQVEIKIELQSNTAYEMELPEVDWIHENPSRALSTYTHFLTIDANTSVEKRTAQVRFIYGDKTEEVTIIQHGKNPIEIEKDTYEFNAGGGFLNVKIASGVTCDIQAPDWIKEEKGTADDMVTLAVLKNPSVEARTGKIILKAGENETTLTVIQQGLLQLQLFTVAGASSVSVPMITASTTVIGQIHWGDGAAEAYKPKAEHAYSTPNSYTITIELEEAQNIHLNKLTGLSGISLAHF